jgi:hypothetical protein
MTKFRNTANGDDSISSVNKPVQLKIQQLSRLTQAAAFSAVL